MERGGGVGGGRVDGFVNVVPRGGVADVGVAGGFGLGEDGVEGVGGFEGDWKVCDGSGNVGITPGNRIDVVS